VSSDDILDTLDSNRLKEKVNTIKNLVDHGLNNENQGKIFQVLNEIQKDKETTSSETRIAILTDPSKAFSHLLIMASHGHHTTQVRAVGPAIEVLEKV
jgi:hypothetical protein